MKKLFFIFFIPIFLMGENLNELIDLSIKNKLVDSYKKDVESLKDEYTSVKRGYLPSFDVNASYSKANHETQSRPNKDTTVSASVDFIVYDGGKRESTFDNYKMNIKSSKKTLESVKNQIALDVTKYYYTYLTLLAKKDAKIKEIKQLNAEHKRLSKFLDVGSTTEDEVQKIVSRVERSTVDLHEIELDLQTVIHNLEYITGKKVDIQSGSEVKMFEDNINEQRDDIEALKYSMKAKLENVGIAKSDYFPTISLNNTYSHYDMDFDNRTFSQPYDDQNVFSVNLKWNIFSFGKTKNDYESKYKRYLSAKSNYEYERNKADVDLELAKKSYGIAILKIKSAKAGLVAANSAYKVIKSKYQNGLIDNVAFLEALSEKYDAISVLKEAEYDLQVKRANVIYNSGKDIKDYIK
ncbi:transporter [Malaciobacter molluscorum LMG 25693]|uniref:RND family efflux system, outer membrane channel protein, TolC family n=1 Tax=Malaciobacter molluscorum LMG 25693 TaxID=870501 RepID=A0A2G1DLT1_9BACT|nr:TolC family protein [Malaciobacter molluscorum]AXX92231.1 RND family efflux system, outer membrane channel protein, TolC family [Malaciobacter molluscorum LMG 25693]PHO19458.1 transporter [Malaciobacter molluscorum LMG 25693]RXJ96319.1 transporter [Malaciobacter molluscorum]